MEVPSGLELIDTANWTARQVDRHSGSAMVAGRLLAFGTAFGTGQDGANQGYGLADPVRAGRPPTGAPVRRQQVSWIQANGDLAYIQLMDANLSNMEGYAVVDLRSGRVLDKGTGTVPELLVPDRV